MSPAPSLLKEPEAKTSYTAKLELIIDVEHKTTTGRKIDDVIQDIQDFIADNEEFWESFPNVLGLSISLVDIRQNKPRQN